jgi:hypothetical protein
MAPDRYAWTIFTAGAPHHYLFDGVTARAFVGTAQVGVDERADAPLSTLARFTAVANLHALRLPGVSLTPLPQSALPRFTAAGLLVVFSDAARYRLGFDDRARVLWLVGPASFAPFGKGELSVRFGDYRDVGKYLVPFHAIYSFGGAPLAEERALAVCANDPALTPEAFRQPELLPDCAPQ